MLSKRHDQWLTKIQTRDTAKKLTQRLSDDGHQVAALTGEYEGSQRDVIIDAFRTGQAKVLITTNVLARGIDVQTVSLVINYVGLRVFKGKITKLTQARISLKMQTIDQIPQPTFTALGVQVALAE